MTASRNDFNWLQRPGFGLDNTIYYHKKTGRLSRTTPEEIHDGRDVAYFSANFIANSPLKVYFDFTHKCNLECKHCITSSSPRAKTDHELSTQRILELISEFSNIGVLELATGGGEPLVRPDWEIIFRAIANSGINLIITTNGLLLNNSTIETLRQINPLEIRVSFDGGPSLHEHIRGAKTYSKAIANLGSLAKSGLNAVARLTLCKGSEDELPVLLDDLAKIGIFKIKAAVIKESGRASTDTSKHLLCPIPHHQTIDWMIKLATDRGIQLQLSSDDFPNLGIQTNDPKIRDSERPNCGAGFETCYISPMGQILGCVTIPDMAFGELHTKPFVEIWQGGIAEDYRSRALVGGKRRICDVLCHHNNQSSSQLINLEDL